MQVLVDMDGVLADIYAQLIMLEHKASGIIVRPDMVQGLSETDAFPSLPALIRSTGFFRTVPLITDSVDGLKYLNEKYSVLIVSSATEFPDSLKEKYDWLTEHFPFISWKQMIFCGSKDSICGDIMIDDHPKNLSSFNGRKILFTQPHNIYVEDFERVSSWKEIMSIL